MARSDRIRVIGVPLDLGQDRRGVEMGPSALRVAGLVQRLAALGLQVEDAGNVPIAPAHPEDLGDPNAKYLGPIAKSCRMQSEWVEQALQVGDFPLVLGGDHSIAIGATAGMCSFFRKRGQNLGLIWLDAHGDCNTPATTPSGNIHGMSLACLLGQGPRELIRLEGYSPMVQPQNAVLVGVHDLDAGEKTLLRQVGVKVYTMRDLDERGMRAVMEEAIGIAGHGAAGIVASLDMDFVDAVYAPGVGTPVRGGATYREAHLAMEILADSQFLFALEVVEINPVLDEHNRTAELAVELILSALGKKIF